MNYVVTILTEKYLYRVNIEGGIKYTLDPEKRIYFRCQSLVYDGQLGCVLTKKNK